MLLHGYNPVLYREDATFLSAQTTKFASWGLCRYRAAAGMCPEVAAGPWQGCIGTAVVSVAAGGCVLPQSFPAWVLPCRM